MVGLYIAGLKKDAAHPPMAGYKPALLGLAKT
jgi:hypothetical protein